MSDKCEWKDGKFEACGFMGSEIFENKHYELLNNSTIFIGDIEAYFCPFCGADIRKPEPEVIIRKSGGTWVALDDGADWIYCDINAPQEQPIFFNSSDQLVHGWAKISEIEITDEIAKLRPMVVHLPNGSITKLAMVDDDRKIVTARGWSGDSDNFRLATVSDLEETK